MNSQAVAAVACVSLAAFGLAFAREDKSARVIDAKLHHLGNDATPEWKEAAKEPEGTRLDVKFKARANAGEWVLFVEQRSVGETWRVLINDEEIATLAKVDDRATRYYTLPPGALKDGENTLSIVPDVPSDDVVVGNLRYHECSLRELYDLQPVEVRVVDSATKQDLPARVTLVDASGVLAPIYYGVGERIAVRDGVVYAGATVARFEIAPGEYTAYATRGFEWSLAQAPLTVAKGKRNAALLELTRELDTRGYVACDTHIHTVTHSGHGDASVEERQVTLAGEGVELAIATDHNHNTDYRPAQKKLGLGEYFTPVVGNEVTTDVGHFNGFPLDPADAIPPHDSKDYVQIVDGIRAKGAKVVILNHPRWPDHMKGPFGVHALDHATGARTPELKLTVDATEMINATTEEAAPMLLFSDWFALLNRGERIFAVGSSDSHTVGDPVGQGRTYVPSKSDDPAKIDVDAACDAIKNGRTSIGMGMFAIVLVGNRVAMGETVVRPGASIDVALRVQAPAWIAPRKALFFLNGVLAAERDVTRAAGQPVDDHIAVTLPLEHPHDAWIVCVVTGDGVSAPYWRTTNPYTLAATNPVFIDRDGGGYQSPRETAAKLLGVRATPDDVGAALSTCDDAVAVHLFELANERWLAAGRSPGDVIRLFEMLLEGAEEAGRARPALIDFVATLVERTR